VRRKLAAAGLPGWVVNVWGVGYKLRHVPGAPGRETTGAASLRTGQQL
jgi:hypothetical protein